MKIYYCWRCHDHLPMLEEQEWEQISPDLSGQIRKIKAYRKEHGCDLKTAHAAVHNDAAEKFKVMTGCELPNYLAIYHHRLSDYGPECPGCGYLLRTNRASHCINCGLSRECFEAVAETRG